MSGQTSAQSDQEESPTYYYSEMEMQKDIPRFSKLPQSKTKEIYSQSLSKYIRESLLRDVRTSQLLITLGRAQWFL